MAKKSISPKITTNPKNDKIIKELYKLVEQIKYNIDNTMDKKDKIAHTYRLRQIQNLISIIKNYPQEIKQGSDLKDIKGVGKGSISRINEILKTGRLSEIKVGAVEKKHVKAVDELQEIIGIGPKKAYELVTKYNIKSIKDLKKAYNNDEIELSHEILMGLKYHNKYKQNIPRAEIDKVNKFIGEVVNIVDKDLKYIISGSYRRKKPISNDIDILITHPKVKTKLQLMQKTNYLSKLVNALKKADFLIDDLTDKDFEVKYMGFGQYYEGKKKFPIRRVDIRYVPYNSYYPALLYFTGSGPFNEKMRGLAKALGYRLNEYGLYKIIDGKLKKIKVTSEKDIFDKLGMDYVPPEERY